MKRKRPRKVSPRRKIIIDCEKLLRPILKMERGAKCEICGRPESMLPYPLSLFHILPRNEAPKLILHSRNILLACFVPNAYIDHKYCHNVWEYAPRDSARYMNVLNRIKALRGEGYRDDLKVLSKMQSPVTMTELHMLRQAFQVQYDQLCKYNDGLEVLYD